MGVLRVLYNDFLPLTIEMHFQQTKVVGLLTLFHQGAQILPPLLFVKAAFRNISADLTGIELRVIGGVFIRGLGHLQGAVQGVANTDIEPVLDAVRQKIDGYQKQYEGRNEGQTDKGRHQLGPDTGTDDTMAALVNQLDDVPHYKEYQQYDQDDIDVDEAEDEDIAGDGQDGFLFGKMGLEKGEQDD